MSLKSVHENLLKIKRTSSTNSKVQLLAEYLQNEEFKAVIQLMYDSTKNYKINILPPYQKPKQDLFTEERKATNSDIFSFLNKLAEQRGASDKDKFHLAKLASIDPETHKVVQMIVKKDAKCGFSAKLINKAYPNLITIMPYCRCSTAKNKIHTINWDDGIFVQEKADGMFVNIIIHEGKIVLRSRSGKEIHQLDHIKDWILQNRKSQKSVVYMGELLIKQNGKILPRKTSNGIFNSCIQGTVDPNVTKDAIVKLWDRVPYDDFWKGECDIPYRKRWSNVVRFVNSIDPERKIFYLIHTKLVFKRKFAKELYNLIRQKNGEGTILKKQNALWKNHTSPDQVKEKNEVEAELRIVGWSYGKEGTKYENILGSLQCETDDGKVKVSISGFTDKEREEDWDRNIGKIVSITYESLILDKKRGEVYSLYLPRIDEVRYERNDTDTLEDLLNR
jgi:DNA ligase-1